MKNFTQREKVKDQDTKDILNKITNGQVFVIKNDEKNTVLDLNTATLGNVANVLATLLKDLKRRNIIG